MKEKDDLGNRMKENYENRTRFFLPRRTYTIIRLDGKAFHSYTRGCQRPYDLALMQAMNETAKVLCEEIMGTKLAYVQSDEISLLVTDFDDIKTEAWFDGNIQKMSSISASIATYWFNRIRMEQQQQGLLINNPKDMAERVATFDSRVFAIPDRSEVANYFVWRQQDCTRNSVSMSAQSHFSHKKLQGKSGSEMQEMLHTECGVNWNDYPVGFKRGRCIIKLEAFKDVIFTDKRTGKPNKISGVTRKFWEIVDPPIFTADREWLMGKIPQYGE